MNEPMSSQSLAISGIAIFAHNEALNIVRCLNSLSAAGCPPSVPVYVLANGCTDNTVQTVERYAATHPNIRPITIEKGDKANAWNIYVHEYASTEGVSIFMDGDVRADASALTELLRALEVHPEAHIASAVPACGRNQQKQVTQIMREHGVQGNLYAIRNVFLHRIRAQGIRMPVGFVREDGLIGALAAWDLDPLHVRWDKARIVPVAQSRFLFDPMPIFGRRGLYTYFRRRVRYSRGYFENELLRPILKQQGAAKMPGTVQQLYAESARCRLGWRGLNTIFDWLALRQIKPWQKNNV